ncbi:MAG TPA: NapC/NirT family cytochrome c [Vicinamibacteria bacterium]|nr:NapC/NirT family cytochrome c [Vicinamibacteria bacterium]
MTLLDAGFVALALTGIFLILLVVARPQLTVERGGKILAFIALFILPLVASWIGTTRHLEHSKSTGFCLSCHEMESYGRSLRLANRAYLPAGHFLNNRVPRDQACYTCHTTYTMFGDVQAKMHGLQHVFVHYLGTIPENIELYNPYSNRECLHCHEGARSFEELEDHVDFKQEIASGDTSCLECHDSVHDIANLEGLETWEGVSR